MSERLAREPRRSLFGLTAPLPRPTNPPAPISPEEICMPGQLAQVIIIII